MLKVLKHVLVTSTVVQLKARARPGVTEGQLEGETWLLPAEPLKAPLPIETLPKAGTGRLLFPRGSSCLDSIPPLSPARPHPFPELRGGGQ